MFRWESENARVNYDPLTLRNTHTRIHSVMLEQTILREQEQKNNVTEASIGQVRNMQIMKIDDKSVF